jgi:hypothetical protein
LPHDFLLLPRRGLPAGNLAPRSSLRVAAALCTAGFAGVAGVRLLAFRCRFSRRLHGFRVNRGPFKAAVRRTGGVRRQRSWILRRVFMPRGRRRCHSVIITRPLNPGPGRSLHDRHSAARQHLQNRVICVHPAARPTQQSAARNQRSVARAGLCVTLRSPRWLRHGPDPPGCVGAARQPAGLKSVGAVGGGGVMLVWARESGSGCEWPGASG